MKILTRKNELPRITAKATKLEYPDFQFIGPSNGWMYPIPETKTVIFAFGFDELVSTVQKHYKANDIAEPSELVRNIHEFLCARLPQFCEEADPQREHKINLWHLAQRFFTAAISAATTGLVSQEEAERRAAICAVCPHNGGSALNLCAGCHTAKFVREAAEALSTKHTSLDDRLFTCQLCECSGKLKVWIDKSAMEERDIKWPSNCWMAD
jgi:hypothetical protein